MVVFGQVFTVLADVISPSIAYHARARMGEVRDNDIIEFWDGIYTRLG